MKRRLLSQLIVRLLMVPLAFAMPVFAQLSTPVFKDWGTSTVWPRPKIFRGATPSTVCASGTLAFHPVANTVAIPSLSGTVCLDLAWLNYYVDVLPAPAGNSVTIQWLLDGAPLGASVVGPPMGTTWDTTTVTNGTHVISLRIVDSTGATYAASQFNSLAQTVLVNNTGSPLGVGAQTIPIQGMYRSSVRDNPAVDFIAYPGTPPHNTVYDYPYQFIAPSNSPTLRPGSAWFIESLTESRTTLYQNNPYFYTTQQGGVVVQGFYPQSGDTAEIAYPLVEHHANTDGGRDDNSVSPYSTFVEQPTGGPCPNAGGWVGIDIAKRIFCVSRTGKVTTIAGYQPLRTVLQYDWKDLTVSDTQLDAKANNLGDADLESPTDIIFDPPNPKIAYIADLLNNRIAKVDWTSGSPVFTNYAGCDPSLACHATGDGAAYVDGTAQTARFNQPISLAMLADGTMYIADFNNNAIRKITSNGATVSTLVGGLSVPSQTVVAASPDTYSSPTPVAFAAAKVPYPQVIRLDSHNNLVLGESISRTVRLIDIPNQLVSRIYGALSGSPTWIWLDVDSVGTIGPVDDIIVAESINGGTGNARMLRLSEDGTYVGRLDSNGTPNDGIFPVEDSSGHYPWVAAISRTEGKFLSMGFGNMGLSEWRIKQSNDVTDLDFNKYTHGRRIYRLGTVESAIPNLAWSGWGSRPAFSSLLGFHGNGHLGLPTFDDLQVRYPTDSALAAYIQSGMGGTVGRPEITGNDLRDLIYYIRRTSLQNGSGRKPSPILPGPDIPDPTPPLTSNVVFTRIGPTTATVTWTTNVPCIGFVAWGSTSNYNGFSPIESGYGTSHSVALTGLPVGGVVHYTAVAKTVGGKQTHSADALADGSTLPPLLSVTKGGTGTGTVASADAFINCGSTCIHTYTSGDAVTLTAAPIGSNTFAGWSGDCSGTGTCALTMNSTKNVIATFNTQATSGPILSVTKGGTGTGIVASADTLINCGSTCAHTYASGDAVTLTAVPIGGNTFAGWSGDCSGTGTCALTMSSTKNVIATFNTPAASGDCTATPNQWCQTYPGTVTLPATPPFGRSWNSLVWNPDLHQAMTWVTDAGQVITFSNALYGFTPQYPNVATNSNAWTKYSSCGSTGSGSPGPIQPQAAFLGTAVSPSDTTVTSRSDFPLTQFASSGFLWIGDEEMSYSSKSGLSFNISARGVRGTSAASHAACVGAAGGAGCLPAASRIAPGCPAPVNGAGVPINDHPQDRHPSPVSAYRSGKIWHAGGYYEAGLPADTWSWDPTNNWVFIPSTNAPANHDDAMAYFADKDVLIKYGGDHTGSQTTIYCFAVDATLGCTATNVWIPLTSARLDDSAGHVAPSRYKHIMIYDSINKQILSVGGANSGAPTPDAQLWSLSYNAGISKWQWTQKANMPYAQQRSPVAFDSHLGKVVLFTASNNSQNGGNGVSQGETWLYDPVLDSWTMTGVTGPLINTFAIAQHMVFNPDNNTLIMDKQSTATTITVYELADSALSTASGALSVSMTAPQPGSAVSGSIAVSATASDNAGTPQVQFTLDGAPLGPQVTSVPYTTLWDTRNVANGPHALVAVLTDPAGNRTASNPVSVTVTNANGPPPLQGVFRDWGWKYIYIHPQLTTTSGNAILTASQAPPPVPIISGVVRVDGAFFDSSYSTAAPPAAGSITVEYAVDGNHSGTYVTGPPLQWDWDSANVPDGTHVLSLRIIDSTDATYPADQMRTEAQTVVVQNIGAVNGAQRLPVPGFYLLSHHEPPAIDWVNYPGTPQHNNVHSYPYKFISPSSSAELRDARNWFIEPLTETRHGLNTSSPHFYTTQRGGVVVQGYFPQAGDTVEGAHNRVEHHYNLDGGRGDNMVDPYSTLVPAPDGTGWVGIDVAGRLFKIGFDGSVTTLAGFSHRRDVLQYDYRDLRVTDAQWHAKATQIGNDSFKGPVDLTFDPRNPGIVYVADTLAHRIAKVDLSVSPPIISTYVGVKDNPGYQDGSSSTAKFNAPYSLIMASDGTMYVADFMNSAIRKISPDGSTVSTLVGGGPMPSARVVAANRDAYSSSAPVGFASAMIPYPQVIRFDSSGNIVVGEMVTRLIRLINLQTHVVSRIRAINPGTSANHSWIWLDVDAVGAIGPKDDVIVAQVVGSPGNVNLWRISHDGSVMVNMGGGGGPVQDGKASVQVTDRAGHYPWIIAISKTEGRFVTTGFGTVGLSSWRILQASDPPMNLDSATFVRGNKIWETGTVAGFPWGSRPSFSSLGGERGTGHLGVIPTFDDLMVLYPTDAALATYIQNGMGGSVPRPEITGNDLRALIYFVRLTSLQRGSLSPVSPGPPSSDSTPPVVSAALAVRLDATTARVTWTTSKPCLGFVAWGSTSNYNGWSDLESGYSTTHSVVVSGLPKTLIHFTAVAKDLAGNQSFAAHATF